MCVYMIFPTLRSKFTDITIIKKSDEDVKDLDEDVYCSIAVTKHM